mmetsp:Transcript_43438/g.85689  ORF Transcript_43438/g.85689 Transcript_43438/m.85689 type:complete len:275 (+) Transcript_43438:229-1053(+)
MAPRSKSPRRASTFLASSPLRRHSCPRSSASLHASAASSTPSELSNPTNWPRRSKHSVFTLRPARAANQVTMQRTSLSSSSAPSALKRCRLNPVSRRLPTNSPTLSSRAWVLLEESTWSHRKGSTSSSRDRKSRMAQASGLLRARSYSSSFRSNPTNPPAFSSNKSPTSVRSLGLRWLASDPIASSLACANRCAVELSSPTQLTSCTAAADPHSNPCSTSSKSVSRSLSAHTSHASKLFKSTKCRTPRAAAASRAASTPCSPLTSSPPSRSPFI